MKKILIILLIAAAAGSVSAEVTIGAQIDMAVVPFQFIKDDDAAAQNEINSATLFMYMPEREETIMGAGIGRFASGQGPRARLDMKAHYEDIIGMRARIQVRTDGIGVEDYLYAYWNPLPGFRINAGRFFDDSLRGKINDMDERMNSYTVRMYDADNIFSRFRTHRNGGQAGFMLSYNYKLNETSELFAGALLYDLMPFTSSPAPGVIFDARPEYVTNDANSYHNIQGTVAYTVKNQFQVRAQYLGAKPQVTINRITDETVLLPATYDFTVFSITAPRIEAAFALFTIPGLIIDIGGKVPLPFKDWDRLKSNIFEKENESMLTDLLYRIYKYNYIWQAPYQASIGVKYEQDLFGIGARVDAKFGGSVKGTKTEMHFPFEINAHIWPSVNLGFASLVLNFGLEYIGATLDEEGKIVQEGQLRPLDGGTRIGAGISLQKNILANCIIKGGVAFKYGGIVNGIQEKTVVSIPLFLDWSF